LFEAELIGHELPNNAHIGLPALLSWFAVVSEEVLVGAEDWEFLNVAGRVGLGAGKNHMSQNIENVMGNVEVWRVVLEGHWLH
jgi:hypothetical protein